MNMVVALQCHRGRSGRESAANGRGDQPGDPGYPDSNHGRGRDFVHGSATVPYAAIAAFGLLALGVGSIGVYSLIAYTVSWRTREFGLRIALGANRMQVAMLIVRESLVLTVGGVGSRHSWGL